MEIFAFPAIVWWYVLLMVICGIAYMRLGGYRVLAASVFVLIVGTFAPVPIAFFLQAFLALIVGVRFIAKEVKPRRIVLCVLAATEISYGLTRWEEWMVQTELLARQPARRSSCTHAPRRRTLRRRAPRSEWRRRCRRR